MELNKKETEWLNDFNGRMSTLQCRIVSEMATVRQELQRRVSDHSDPLTGFEVDARVEYVLAKDDPLCRGQASNIMTVRDYDGTENAGLLEIDSASGWADRPMQFGVRNHSFLLHDLYDHGWGPGKSQLDVADILRIGEVRVCIRPVLQFHHAVPSSLAIRQERELSWSWREQWPVATVSGQIIDVMSLSRDIDSIRIEDIAQGLANKCMYHGQTREFYSYAQHSLILASRVPDELKLAALLYKAHCAYVNDPDSWKGFSAEISWIGREAEDGICRLRHEIARRYGIAWRDFFMLPHEARRRVQATERRDLLPTMPDEWQELAKVVPLEDAIVPMTPREARQAYLASLDEWIGKGK